jgi:hypothetical protein
MSMLYQNERQVLTVIRRYQQEARDANQLRAVGINEERRAERVATSLFHTIRDLVSRAWAHTQHAPTTPVKPNALLHTPE